MRIQHVSVSGQNNRFERMVEKENRFNEAEVFDDYDINIVDFTDDTIWRSVGLSPGYSIEHSNIHSVSSLLKMSKSTSVILLPKNINFFYNYYDHKYTEKRAIKDILETIQKCILLELYPRTYDLTFGRSTTTLCGIEVNSDFFFSKYISFDTVTETAAGKVTTIRTNNIYFTTINIENADQLELFFKQIGLEPERKEDAPEWFAEIKAFDDLQLEEAIEESEITIKSEREKIDKAKKQLEQNSKWKSILYETGNELERTVYQIFDTLFNTNLKEFIDEKKEDFRFEYADMTVIGEIKGVEGNVKKKYISQLDTHVQEYLDDYAEKSSEEIVSLLIVNHQRKADPKNRESIPADQIRLAERNGSLIIETTTLLKLFEKYTSAEQSEEECWNLLSQTIGLLVIE